MTGVAVEFRILGPLALSPSIELGGPRERKILATLVLLANQPVSIQYLIDVLWPAPPNTARQQVQNCVGAIRARLHRNGIRAEILRCSTSYSLQLDDSQADILVFRRLCREAEEVAARGDVDSSAQHLRAALRLWRGQALEDIDSSVLEAHATALEESRVRVIEEYVRLEMSRHRVSAVLSDLTIWVQRYPYHEGLHCSLADGLAEMGRTAEALQILHDLSKRLRRDLGIDVGRPTHETERRLLLCSGQEPPSDDTHAPGESDLVREIDSAMSSLASIRDRLTRMDRTA